MSQGRGRRQGCDAKETLPFVWVRGVGAPATLAEMGSRDLSSCRLTAKTTPPSR